MAGNKNSRRAGRRTAGGLVTNDLTNRIAGRLDTWANKFLNNKTAGGLIIIDRGVGQEFLKQ